MNETSYTAEQNSPQNYRQKYLKDECNGTGGKYFTRGRVSNIIKKKKQGERKELCKSVVLREA